LKYFSGTSLVKNQSQAGRQSDDYGGSCLELRQRGRQREEDRIVRCPVFNRTIRFLAPYVRYIYMIVIQDNCMCQ